MRNKKSIIRTNTSRLLEDCDISQKDIAKVVGVTSQSVSRWKKGLSIPKLKHRKKLAKALDITIEQLTADNSESTTSSPVQDVVAEDTRLKLIIQYLEKIIGLLEPPTTEEKEKLISQERSTPSPERKMGSD